MDSIHVVQQRRSVSGDAVRLDPRPGVVAGREELLATLRARLADASDVTVVALSGLSGVGKTTAALEYTYRNASDYRILWHFHAEDSTAMLSQFHSLARVLDAGDTDDPVAAVHTILARHPGRWLIVLDNVPSYEAARQWLPARGRGHVIVTTQDGHWPAEQILEVPTMDLDAAEQFLLSRSGSDDADAARLIATELGTLPLALAQAAAFVAATGRTLPEYLQLLRSERSMLLGRGAPAEHTTPVVATWSLAMADLERTMPGAVALLQIAAFLAPDDIPFRLLLESTGRRLTTWLARRMDKQVRGLLTSPLALDDAVTSLRRFSLIGRPGDTFSVHRVVQAVTRDRLEPRERKFWRLVTRLLVEAAVPKDARAIESWARCRQLLPHAQVAAGPRSKAMRQLGIFLFASGDYAAARTHMQNLAHTHSGNLGADHHETLLARSNAALMTGETGDAVSALEAFKALLPIFERVVGPHHPHSLTVRGQIARWTGETGDAAAARDMYANLLPLREKVSGARHPDTLIVHTNLAQWTGRAGDPAAARDMLAELLPLREKASGPEHPETLAIRKNLAHWTGAAGNAAASRDMVAELLPLQEKVSGPEHPDTLAARADLARSAGEAGDPAAARDMLAELLSIYEKALGPEHPDTLVIWVNLAHWTMEAGNPAAAREILAALLPVRERVSGPEHPETLTVRANIARSAGEAGDPAAARDMLAELVPLVKKVLGPEHPETLIICGNFASTIGEAGDPIAARDMSAALLPLWERVSGPEHPSTLSTRTALAHWTGRAGDPITARDMLAELLVLRERISGPHHQETAQVRRLHGYWVVQAQTARKSRQNRRTTR